MAHYIQLTTCDITLNTSVMECWVPGLENQEGGLKNSLLLGELSLSMQPVPQYYGHVITGAYFSLSN